MIFRNTLTCAFAIACSMSATIPAWGQQEAERQVQVDAAIGQTMRLRGHVNYSHGCSDVIPTDITVIQAPLYGTLTIKNEVVHAKDAELGRGCVGSSGMGKVVYYTRAHEGTDRSATTWHRRTGSFRCTSPCDPPGPRAPRLPSLPPRNRRCRRRLS